MRRRFLSSSNSNYCFIVYTTSDENVINLEMPNIISNSYDDGVGYIQFSSVHISLPNNVFQNCSNLTSVILGNGILSIGNYAFSGCSSLTSITMPDSITKIWSHAFYNCNSLTSVTIPDSVTEIGMDAFSGCSSIASVTIGNSVTSIGSHAFYGCSSLYSVYISDLSAWCKIGFGDYDSNPLRNGAKLYLNRTKVTELIIPSDITEIKRYAFYNCDGLTSITIPDRVTSIGVLAFADCNNLASVTIGNGVTFIDNQAFSGCSSLAEFNGKYASADKRCLVLDGVLHSFAPAGLTEYTIPDSVTSIGSRAFLGCSSLTSITIGNGVTSISSLAFSGCSSLTSVTIPDSVTSIENYAFISCSRLTEVYCKPTTPPTGGSSMFDSNASGRKIYVPRESVDAYKAADYWNAYKFSIVAYNFN